MTTAEEVASGFDLSGAVHIVTGATSGLGFETARVLAAAGARVVMTGRNSDALGAARGRVLSEDPSASVTTVELDLASMRSVRAAAATIAEQFDGIDGLINNAGVMFTPEGRTYDGFELQFGTNYLGHFELTRHLTPALERRAGRVVNLSSDAHKHGDIDLSDPNWQATPYDKFRAYSASKTANVLFSVAINERLGSNGLRAFAVHPGVVATNLARHMTKGDMRKMMSMGDTAEHGAPAPRLEWVTPESGASTSVWAAVSPDLDPVNGVYLAGCRVAAPAEHAIDRQRAQQLWEMSERLISGTIRSRG